MSIQTLRFSVLSSLMAALMAIGAYLHIPIGPVPLVLTNLFVFLSGLLLGGRWGLISVTLYLFVGAIGMPVFYGGKGGLAHLIGPTGGYLFGFLFSAGIVGFISTRLHSSLLGDIIAVMTGSLIIYAFGVPWLKMMTKISWDKAYIVGMIPFLPGDALKAGVSIILARSTRPILHRQIKTHSFLDLSSSQRQR